MVKKSPINDSESPIADSALHFTENAIAFRSDGFAFFKSAEKLLTCGYGCLTITV